MLAFVDQHSPFDQGSTIVKQNVSTEKKNRERADFLRLSDETINQLERRRVFGETVLRKIDEYFDEEIKRVLNHIIENFNKQYYFDQYLEYKIRNAIDWFFQAFRNEDYPYYLAPYYARTKNQAIEYQNIILLIKIWQTYPDNFLYFPEFNDLNLDFYTIIHLYKWIYTDKTKEFMTFVAERMHAKWSRPAYELESNIHQWLQERMPNTFPAYAFYPAPTAEQWLRWLKEVLFIWWWLAEDFHSYGIEDDATGEAFIDEYFSFFFWAKNEVWSEVVRKFKLLYPSWRTGLINVGMRRSRRKWAPTAASKWSPQWDTSRIESWPRKHALAVYFEENTLSIGSYEGFTPKVELSGKWIETRIIENGVFSIDELQLDSEKDHLLNLRIIEGQDDFRLEVDQVLIKSPILSYARMHSPQLNPGIAAKIGRENVDIRSLVPNIRDTVLLWIQDSTTQKWESRHPDGVIWKNNLPPGKYILRFGPSYIFNEARKTELKVKGVHVVESETKRNIDKAISDPPAPNTDTEKDLPVIPPIDEARVMAISIMITEILSKNWNTWAIKKVNETDYSLILRLGRDVGYILCTYSGTWNITLNTALNQTLGKKEERAVLEVIYDDIEQVFSAYIMREKSFEIQEKTALIQAQEAMHMQAESEMIEHLEFLQKRTSTILRKITRNRDVGNYKKEITSLRKDNQRFWGGILFINGYQKYLEEFKSHYNIAGFSIGIKRVNVNGVEDKTGSEVSLELYHNEEKFGSIQSLPDGSHLAITSPNEKLSEHITHILTSSLLTLGKIGSYLWVEHISLHGEEAISLNQVLEKLSSEIPIPPVDELSNKQRVEIEEAYDRLLKWNGKIVVSGGFTNTTWFLTTQIQSRASIADAQWQEVVIRDERISHVPVWSGQKDVYDRIKGDPRLWKYMARRFYNTIFKKSIDDKAEFSGPLKEFLDEFLLTMNLSPAEMQNLKDIWAQEKSGGAISKFTISRGENEIALFAEFMDMAGKQKIEEPPKKGKKQKEEEKEETPKIPLIFSSAQTMPFEKLELLVERIKQQKLLQKT
jgi:hypothetical protein